MDFGIGAGLDNLNTATTFANVDVSQAEREVLRSLQARKPHQVTQS